VLAFVCAMWVGGAEYHHLEGVGAGYRCWGCRRGGCSVFWVSGCVGGSSDGGGWVLRVFSLGHVCVRLGHGWHLVVMLGLFVCQELRIVRERGGGGIWLRGTIECCRLSSL